jgi:mono/diheme cytochrome c family protein
MAERMGRAGIARPRLDARETGDLAAYLYTLNYFDRVGNATAGRRLFADKRCAECHSIGGKGRGQGPDLGSLGAYASPIAIAAAMWNHAPRMAMVMKARGIPRPTFEGSQLLDLITYLKAASPRPKRAELYVLPGSATNGRLLFADKRCVVCHAIVKRGDDEAPDLVEGQAQRSLTQFATAMWNKAPAMLRAMEAKQISPPSLRPEEMADIVAYLYPCATSASRAARAKARSSPSTRAASTVTAFMARPARRRVTSTARGASTRQRARSRHSGTIRSSMTRGPSVRVGPGRRSAQTRWPI